MPTAWGGVKIAGRIEAEDLVAKETGTQLCRAAKDLGLAKGEKVLACTTPTSWFPLATNQMGANQRHLVFPSHWRRSAVPVLPFVGAVKPAQLQNGRR